MQIQDKLFGFDKPELKPNLAFTGNDAWQLHITVLPQRSLRQQLKDLFCDYKNW